MELMDFLLARIAEDETSAKGGHRITLRASPPPDGWSVQIDSGGWWQPDRVLAECAAKRRIVEEHRPTKDGRFCGCCWLSDLESWEPHPCPTLRALALLYADHPDYREEWRP